jgi:ornithine cyclodeaminase
VILFSAEDGVPAVILDAGSITGIRTAAATAVATDALARKDVRTLAIMGCGEQARNHVEALPKVRRFQEIMIWGRDYEKAKAFCANDGRLTPVKSLQEAAQADVICTTTGAREPFFTEDLLRPGQHLNVIGSSIPTTSEIDVGTVARSRFYTDYVDSALALAGDFRRAKEQGAVGDDHIIGAIGDVLAGRAPGRQSDDEITLFKSLGMICEDLVSADYILKVAAKTGAGQMVEW